MSDDFFEKYNAMNNDQPASRPAENTPDASQPNRDYGAGPAYGQPAQPQTYRTPSYSAPQQNKPSYDWSSSSYTNPYSSRPDRSATVEPSSPYGAASPAANEQKPSDSGDGYYHRSFTERNNRPDPKQKKKGGSGFTIGSIAMILVICLIVSLAAGFGGSMIANAINSGSQSQTYDSVSDELVIHKVDVKEEQADTKLADKTTEEITEAVADSVVEITTEVVQTSTFYGQYIAQGAGSGVIISEDGYIVTNNHVIEDASSITVTLRSGESYEAKLVGTDELQDIALLKIEADKELSVAVFGDSSTLSVGSKAVIIGNPLGTLGGSVTEGIISALDRSIILDGKTMRLMQTDAAINPGNSGGGMFNGQGELVGIVVAKNVSGEIDNIGFVIPINNVLDILGDLKQYGYVRGRVDTGMSFMDISNSIYAWYYYGTTTPGCYISDVDRGSNAAQAGFEVGDRIISVDGTKIDSSDQISDIITSKSVGDTVTFEVERKGRTGTLELTLEEKVPDGVDVYNR